MPSYIKTVIQIKSWYILAASGRPTLAYGPAPADGNYGHTANIQSKHDFLFLNPHQQQQLCLLIL